MPAEKNGRDGGVQSLQRAFELLEHLADVGGEASLSELATLSGLPMPTIHRLIRTLVDLGYVRQNTNRRYALGARLIRLGENASMQFGAWARPLLAELVEEVGFSGVYAFTYSPRPGTAAPRLGGAVDPSVASERLQRLFALQEGIQRQINGALVGRELDVLVTGWGKQPGTQTGRTPCHRVIHFAAGAEPVSLGGVTRVQVEEAFAYSLLGRRNLP